MNIISKNNYNIIDKKDSGKWVVYALLDCGGRVKFGDLAMFSKYDDETKTLELVFAHNPFGKDCKWDGKVTDATDEEIMTIKADVLNEGEQEVIKEKLERYEDFRKDNGIEVVVK